MKQNHERKLVKDAVKLMIKNGVDPIYPEKIATPLIMLTEDVRDILLNVGLEFGLSSAFNIHCLGCGKLLARCSPMDYYADVQAPISCDECNSISYPRDGVEVFCVIKDEIFKAIEDTISYLLEQGHPPKFYPTLIADYPDLKWELAARKYGVSHVVYALSRIMNLEFYYEFHCPYCGRIHAASYPEKYFTPHYCQTCQNDIGPIWETDYQIVFRHGLDKPIETLEETEFANITPELIYRRRRLEQRRLGDVDYCPQGRNTKG